MLPATTLEQPLHIETPLLKSKKLSDRVGCSVWLKLENVQNSGSFKIRGLGHFCQKAVRDGCTLLVSSSGGNAGLAAIFCAQVLCVPIIVVVPETTPDFIITKMRSEGAKVEVLGSAWDEANEHALEIASQPGAALVHPFDHPDIWCGHASLVLEVEQQLCGRRPDLVVLSVGGGGLLCGILQGLKQVGWASVPVLAMETRGAASLNACVGAKQWVALDKISSIARCLGAKRVCHAAYENLSKHKVISRVVSDNDALSACVALASDHEILVVPACGASLAALYGDTVRTLQDEGALPLHLKDIVVVVCGGSGVTMETITLWKNIISKNTDD